MKIKTKWREIIKKINKLIGFRDILVIAGIALLFYGIYLIYIPAAFITIGIIFIIAGAGFVYKKGE